MFLHVLFLRLKDVDSKEDPEGAPAETPVRSDSKAPLLVLLVGSLLLVVTPLLLAASCS